MSIDMCSESITDESPTLTIKSSASKTLFSALALIITQIYENIFRAGILGSNPCISPKLRGKERYWWKDIYIWWSDPPYLSLSLLWGLDGNLWSSGASVSLNNSSGGLGEQIWLDTSCPPTFIYTSILLTSDSPMTYEGLGVTSTWC